MAFVSSVYCVGPCGSDARPLCTTPRPCLPALICRIAAPQQKRLKGLDEQSPQNDDAAPIAEASKIDDEGDGAINDPT